MTESEPIRTLLADDHAMVREALAQILSESGRIRVVAQAASGLEALTLAAQEGPDVVVLDYSMPGLDAPATLARLRDQRPAVKVVVLTVHESLHYAVKALEAGARGYVVKSAALRELVEAIETVHAGEVYISPQHSHRVLKRLRRPRRDRAGLDALSAREFELLRALAAGMSLKQCAEESTPSPTVWLRLTRRSPQRVRNPPPARSRCAGGCAPRCCGRDPRSPVRRRGTCRAGSCPT